MSRAHCQTAVVPLTFEKGKRKKEKGDNATLRQILLYDAPFPSSDGTLDTCRRSSVRPGGARPHARVGCVVPLFTLLNSQSGRF